MKASRPCSVIAKVTLALSASSPLFAQSKGTPTSTVPFVGCASSGQIERFEAPKGTSRSVPIGSEHAKALAYYLSADGIGILAPRGWHCEGASGSSGATLLLSPKPIHRDSSGWHGLEGPAIEVNHLDGGTSGRYGIAEIVARVFPEYRAFAVRVLEDMLLPIPNGPYPKDSVINRSTKIVEYKTPAQTEGLGNYGSPFGRNDLPISGAAMIVGDSDPPPSGTNGPDLILLSVRFPPALTGLIPVIIDQFERGKVSALRP